MARAFAEDSVSTAIARRARRPWEKFRRRGFPGGQIYVATELNDPAWQPEKSSESCNQKKALQVRKSALQRAHTIFFCRETRQLAVLVPARSAILHQPTHPPTRTPTAHLRSPLPCRRKRHPRDRWTVGARAVPVAAHARHVSRPPSPAPEVAARGRGWRAQCPRAAIDFPLMASMMGAACPQ